MAFPFVYESNFETGDSSEWDSETDTASQLDFPNYSDLAKLPWPSAAPFQGAYCMRAVLSGGTADAFVLEGAIDLAANTTNFYRLYVWFDPDFTGTADDIFNLFELQSSGPVVEVAFGARIVAATNVINFGIGEVAPTSFGANEIERGVWYAIELDVDLDNAGANDGTIDIYVTKEGEPAATTIFATQVASLDQAAVIQGVLGVQDHDATTTGTILFDGIIADDARIYPVTERFSDNVLLTKSAHIFVGQGEVDNVTLMSGAGADNVLTIYDTDKSNSNDATNVKGELKNTANNEVVDPAGMPVQVTRGAFVTLAGTNPRGNLKISRSHTRSVATLRQHGVRS